MLQLIAGEKAGEQRWEEKENSTKVISAASLSHICSSGKQKQRGGESECVRGYVRETEFERDSKREKGWSGGCKEDGVMCSRASLN